VFFWKRLPEVVSDNLGGWTLVSLLIGGFGHFVLKIVYLGAPTALFVLAAGTTVLVVLPIRLVSPLHEGLKPQRQGVELPVSANLEGQ
jgi:hypothetical protein